MSVQAGEPRCDSCHEPLDLDEKDISIIEIPYSGIQQLKNRYPELYTELMQKDGRIVSHRNCPHPLKELIGLRSAESCIELEYCHVCGITVMPTRDECLRCGAHTRRGSNEEAGD